MSNVRFGFDLGTNSIGWAVLRLDSKGNPDGIEGSGVRIFTDGRDPKSLASLKADRRLARQARRRRDRYKQRKTYLLAELTRYGLMPENEEERKKLVGKDPYKLRAQALEQELDPHDIGRALFHLNQRRGFKSNRKSADGEDGVVRASVKAMQEKLKGRTMGQFLAERRRNSETVRARRHGTKKTDLYELYPNRKMLEDEFDRIWEAQSQFNPALYSEETGKHLREVIFFQRKLKAPPVGRCTFIPEEDRAPKALPSSQRFRILKELNNLEWLDHYGRGHPIRENLLVRNHIADALEKSQKRTFEQISKILQKQGIVDTQVDFNLQSEIREYLDGNTTSHTLAHKDRFGPHWHNLSLREQDDIVRLLLDDELTDEEVQNALMDKWGLPPERAEATLNARLADGHVRLSTEAMERMMPMMDEQGMPEYEAATEAFGSHSALGWKDELLNELPYYGRIIEPHTVGGDGEPASSDEKRYGAIPNPTVHIALNQLRRVFNDLLRIYGKPQEIVLELARDLPLGAEGKRDLQARHKKNQDRNDQAREKLRELKQKDNRKNRQRYLLWEELNADPTKRRCPFSGEQISIHKLFTAQVETEHLLPFSLTLDDGLSNQTLASRQANRDKGNRTPFEAFGNSPAGYDWQEIWERAKALPRNKQWRFQEDAMDRFKDENDFLARHLNDTRYISRLAKEYLECVTPKNKIWVLTGRLTALLRTHWGLNGILLPDRNEEDEAPVRKSRDDHRHHAVDAIVIGMTTSSMVQRASTAAGRAEELDLERLFSRDDLDPWQDFRKDVRKSVSEIIVSHRRREKDQGQLHNETAYGIVETDDKTGVSLVVHRIDVASIKKTHIEKEEGICDLNIKAALHREITGISGDTEVRQAVEKWCSARDIRRLRVCERLSVVPIRDRKTGKVYKAYKGDANAYYDIYRNPKTGKWDGEVISTFDANQKNFVPNWRREYPTAKLIMRLRKDDMVEMDHDDGRRIMRVQKISPGIIALAEHFEANVDSRNRDKEDLFKFVYKSPSALEKANAFFVHISPAGLITRRNRDGSEPC